MRVDVPVIFGIGVGKSAVIASFDAMVEFVLAMVLARVSVDGRICVFEVRGPVLLLVSVDLSSIETNRRS
jgi:hypothetical protein